MIPHILSRFAYPASVAHRDLSKHGSLQDVEDVKKIQGEEARDIEEQELLKASLKETPPQVTVSSGDDLHVTPVGAEAESSASGPARFTFRDPSLGSSGRGRNFGKPWRPGRGRSRNSSPPREVGPDNTLPNGEDRDDPLPNMDDGSSDDDENDEDPAQEPPPQVESQGGEQTDEDDDEDEESPHAPLGTIHDLNWGYWYTKCRGWSARWSSLSNLAEDDEWPPGVRVVSGRMFLYDKMCVPTPIQREWIR